jgi:hypothetical protein
MSLHPGGHGVGLQHGFDLLGLDGDDPGRYVVRDAKGLRLNLRHLQHALEPGDEVSATRVDCARGRSRGALIAS